MSQVSRSCQETAALCSAIQTSRQNFTSSWQCVLCFGIYEPLRQGHDSPSGPLTLKTQLECHKFIQILSHTYTYSHLHRVMQCHAYMVTVHFGWIRCNFKMQCQSVLYIFCAKTSASRRSFSCEICIQFLQDLHRVILMKLQIQCELDLHSTCLRYHDISRHSVGINDFFSEHTWSFFILSSRSLFPLPDSQTPRLHAPWLDHHVQSFPIFLRLGPAELFADFLLRLAVSLRASPQLRWQQPIRVSTTVLVQAAVQIFRLMNWRLGGMIQITEIYPGGRMGDDIEKMLQMSFLLLITSSCKSRKAIFNSNHSLPAIRRFGVKMRLGLPQT